MEDGNTESKEFLAATGMERSKEGEPKMERAKAMSEEKEEKPNSGKPMKKKERMPSMAKRK